MFSFHRKEMLYAILFLLLFGLTLSTIGLYLVRRDWNDPELRELSILWVYIAIAFIQASSVLLFFVVVSPSLAGPDFFMTSYGSQRSNQILFDTLEHDPIGNSVGVTTGSLPAEPPIATVASPLR